MPRPLLGAFDVHLSTDQLRRLDALANRPTLYEAVVVRGDGRCALLAYCPAKTKGALARVLASRASLVQQFVRAPVGTPATPVAGFPEIVLGRWGRVELSGRTKRDAICDGEHPYVGDLVAAEA